mmetsp:Transcript_19514/g.52571  ORF Transcript_19514/g.52571 Transcript_19514/m.52571 type:complete len:209 (-) Transcript_19514:27-653(-)
MSYWSTLSTPMPSMKPFHRSPPASAFFKVIVTVGCIASSVMATLAEDGSTVPRRTQDQMPRPNTVIVVVVSVMSTSMAAAGWPRRPGIVRAARTVSMSSSHAHPMSLAPATPLVFSCPEVFTPAPGSARFMGVSRSAMVKPRSATETLAGSSPALAHTELRRATGARVHETRDCAAGPTRAACAIGAMRTRTRATTGAMVRVRFWKMR